MQKGILPMPNFIKMPPRGKAEIAARSPREAKALKNNSLSGGGRARSWAGPRFGFNQGLKYQPSRSRAMGVRRRWPSRIIIENPKLKVGIFLPFLIQ